MKLNLLLKKENNNLDIFRVIAALMVIYGHAYAIAPQVGKVDFFTGLFSESSSGFAVKIFFFLSGLVVTNSLLIKQSSWQFVIARIFRIWPALIFTVIVSAVLIGPILSDLSFRDYFANKQTYAYFYNNIRLFMTFHLPGVFTDNFYKDAVNGSIWSIAIEIAAYCVLLALFNFGFFKIKVLSLIILILIFIDTLNAASLFNGNIVIAQLAFCFSLGSVFTVYQKNININAVNVISIWVLYYVFSDTIYSSVLLQLAFFIIILYISSIDFIVKRKFKDDISYGIYLWGFPVQQILSKYFLDYGVVFNQVFSMIIACILGYISWNFIEKRSIQLGAKIINLNPYRADELSRQLDVLYPSSSSWRNSSPFRWLNKAVKIVRKLASTPHLFSDFVQVAYKKGIWPAFSAAYQVAIESNAIADTSASSPINTLNDYDKWIELYDSPTVDELSRFSLFVSNLPKQPKISVLMPTCNPDIAWLGQAIKSVQAQIYTNWELCIADDASTDPEVRSTLEQLVREDNRIKVIFRPENGHISAASNSALELVTGEWTALMDHDDLLPAHALAWVVHAINENPHARLIYSDEDKIDDADKRSDPYFKCDWNIDLFYSQNMFSHLGVYSTNLIREVGGFRLGFEGSQDWDLALRCVEKIDSVQIHHIPRVLYHWRIHAQSTAANADVKPYAAIAGEKAVNEHLMRTGRKAKVESVGVGHHIYYDLPHPLPSVSIVIPTKNAKELVEVCINSIRSLTHYQNYEIVLIDNGSDDVDSLVYFEYLKSNNLIKYVRDDGEFNYSALNNRAIQDLTSDVIVLLNNDTEVIAEDWLKHMVGLAIQKEVGAVGALLRYPNMSVQHAGVVIGMGGVAGHAHKQLANRASGYFCRAKLTSGFSAVTAACLAVERVKYEQIGGLDEVHLKVAFNDVDFCLRLKEAGYRNVFTPLAELIHHESISRGSDLLPEQLIRFTKEISYMKSRWNTSQMDDPAYSPNLTLDVDDFSYAWPPRMKLISDF